MQNMFIALLCYLSCFVSTKGDIKASDTKMDLVSDRNGNTRVSIPRVIIDANLHFCIQEWEDEKHEYDEEDEDYERLESVHNAVRNIYKAELTDFNLETHYIKAKILKWMNDNGCSRI